MRPMPDAGKRPRRRAGRRDDSPAVAAWRARMATDEAKAIYTARAATAEWVNADGRTHRTLGRIARARPREGPHLGALGRARAQHDADDGDRAAPDDLTARRPAGHRDARAHRPAPCVHGPAALHVEGTRFIHRLSGLKEEHTVH